jgi:hypothetical protein
LLVESNIKPFVNGTTISTSPLVPLLQTSQKAQLQVTVLFKILLEIALKIEAATPVATGETSSLETEEEEGEEEETPISPSPTYNANIVIIVLLRIRREMQIRLISALQTSIQAQQQLGITLKSLNLNVELGQVSQSLTILEAQLLVEYDNIALTNQNIGTQ